MMDALIVTGFAFFDQPELQFPILLVVVTAGAWILYNRFYRTRQNKLKDKPRRTHHHSRERPPHTSREDIRRVYDALAETHAAFFEESDDEDEDVSDKGERLDQLLLDAIDTVKPWLDRETAAEN